MLESHLDIAVLPFLLAWNKYLLTGEVIFKPFVHSCFSYWIFQSSILYHKFFWIKTTNSQAYTQRNYGKDLFLLWKNLLLAWEDLKFWYNCRQFKFHQRYSPINSFGIDASLNVFWWSFYLNAVYLKTALFIFYRTFITIFVEELNIFRFPSIFPILIIIFK